MGYHTTRRRSSFHWTASAYLGFGIGLARCVSYAERRSSKSVSTSFSSRRNQHGPSHAKRRPSRSTSSSDPSHWNKAAPSYPYYHRVVVPEPEPESEPFDHTLHAFCVVTDATYARLSARLEALRGHRDDVAARIRGTGDIRGMGRVLESLREDVGRLDRTLD
jgi:hypothetical protein